jgi:DNA helicase-2/ATP-dependent DNA helicase PcrA
LSKLNDSQRKAVEATEGPVMVIAGAGSGKTRVLTYRIAHLINKGVDPFNILALTFTNKAAREMKERIEKIVGPEAKNLWMGTFHSVFARILRIEADRLGYPSNFTIYDADDSKRLITNIIKEMNLDTEVYKPKAIQGRISALKNNLITPKNYYSFPDQVEYDNSSRRPEFGKIYQAYVDRCFRAGAMDFDDLLLKTNELLNKFPEVLLKYQNRFRYILVDEYQDTNHSQYIIVKALASRFENICVVGDDAQSIYAFRGANIRNILNFKKDYSDAQLYKLEQNYRSTKVIVDAANGVIRKNKEQLEKNVWTANDDGEKITVYKANSDNQEGAFVADSILEKQLGERVKPGEFAILYRTNAQSRAFEEALRKRGIPYRIYGGLSFYQRKEVKDLLSYLKLVVNPMDEEAFRRVVNYPARGIGKTTMERLVVAANKYEKPLWEVAGKPDVYPDTGYNNATKSKLMNFVRMIESFQILAQQYDAFELTKHVAASSGILKELKQDNTPEGVSRVENIEELLNSVKEFVEERNQPDVEDVKFDLSTYLEEVSLISDLDKDDKEDGDKVSLMTIHLAKGLEFPHVYIVGLEEALFPSMMSLNSRSDLEEERRLFYVALTRAEKSATLTWATTRYRWGKLIDNEPSRFLDELDLKHLKLSSSDALTTGYADRGIFEKHNVVKKETESKPKRGNFVSQNTSRNLKPLESTEDHAVPVGEDYDFRMNINPGMVILHERFGKGTVEKIEGDGTNKKAVVNFEGSGTKKLLLKFAKLKVLKNA